MADNNSGTGTNPSGDGSMNGADMDMIIGLSVSNALGGSGEVFGRPNNTLYSNPALFDALGLPRNRFNFMPTSTQPNFTMGSDLRTVLGGNAQMFSNDPSGRFAQNVLAALATGGIFGLLFAVGEFNHQLEEEKKAEAQRARNGGNQPPAANGTGEITNAGATTPETTTPTPTSLRPPVVEAGGEETAPAVRTPSRVAASPATGSTGGNTAESIEIRVPNGVEAPSGAVCEAPTSTSTSRLCVVTKPPKMG